jgi:hypothetical protein
MQGADVRGREAVSADAPGPTLDPSSDDHPRDRRWFSPSISTIVSVSWWIISRF